MRAGGRPWSRVRAAVVAVVVAGQTILAGCWGIPPMDQRGLVMLLGVDAGAPDGYQVTTAILNPLGQPNVQGTNAGGTPELVRSASAQSVVAAIQRLAATSYLTLDFRHLTGVVVSEALARQGLAAPLETMLRSSEFDTRP